MKTVASLMTVAAFTTLAFAGDALAQAKQPAEPKQPGYNTPAAAGNQQVRPVQKPDDLGLWRGSKIIGQNVRDSQGKNIGKIEDLMVDSKGHVSFAVMSFGGFLGMGEKYFAVPWTAMRFDRDGKDVDAVVLDVTKEQIEKAPSFTRDNWPDTRDPKWREDARRPWGTPRAEKTSADSTITAKVKAKLASEKAATLMKVNVDTRQGVVELKGTVDSEQTRMRATDLARQVDGVRDVVNNLKVGG
jgi:BON domain-containing protein/PRC-barrel domain protein